MTRVAYLVARCDVRVAEAWESTGGRVSSHAFCLLFKLFTLKLTVKQIKGLLNHTDSPYIRAIGFLYLRYGVVVVVVCVCLMADGVSGRYVCPPTKIYDWFEPYFSDEEDIVPRNKGKQMYVWLPLL